MKKWIAGLVMISMLVPGLVFAEETEGVLTPDSEVYETVLLIESAEYDLTEEPEDKVLLEEEFADNRLDEIEEVLLQEGDPEVVEELLEDLDGHIALIDENMEKIRLKGLSGADLEAAVAEKFADRTAKMNALLASEDLTEEAKAGIAKAIANQERAMENFIRAKEQAGQGQANNADKITGQDRAAQNAEKPAKAEKSTEKPANANNGKGKGKG